MSPMATAMLSSHPTATPNSAAPSYAFFILRQRRGRLPTVCSIHHQDSAPFPGALGVSRPDWQTSSAIISSRAVAASGSSSDKSPAPSDDPSVAAPETDNGGLTNHRLPTTINGASTGSASLTAGAAAAAGALDLASMAETRAQNALAEIQEFTSFLRVLGSYPMDMTPWGTPSPSSSCSSTPPPPSSQSTSNSPPS
ncbi:arogenate dehydratase/prephenate dehydratase 6, chloroplastic-like [Canna indica]|uniref:Arogenate dehydratase/prephenate dehydratase 6, chloroplastic-like n=1 Tax=Canna indica TaxID=4628 RepID=A0AAQ3K9A9_9LILI|nr:arogenate dehydratase/prephenate dehydratase 6, chloroplastic-like [Canna indica]